MPVHLDGKKKEEEDEGEQLDLYTHGSSAQTAKVRRHHAVGTTPEGVISIFW